MTATIDATHDPALTSWVEGADGHEDFPVQNLPLGIFAPPDGAPRAGTAIGEQILCLAGIAEQLPIDRALVEAPTLNALLASGAPDRRALRAALSAMLIDPARRSRLTPHLYPADACTMRLPATIGDYSDFYAGIHHATNVGRQFRPDNPLLPNYKWLPVGYHGRASSVRVSGEPVVRPSGQRMPVGAAEPVFGPAARLDHEVELGVWIGRGNRPGEPIPIAAAADHIAGLCLLNDWSARDLQTWEYQPLGPFLAKSFHTTISPWIVTGEALAPFRLPQPARAAGDPRPLPYLWSDEDQANGAYAIEIDAWLASATMRRLGTPALRLSRAAATDLYWTVAQMVAHHSANGCDLRPGDLIGTGTISAPTHDGYGSMLELTEGGARPLALPSGEERGFLADGDELTLTGRAAAAGYRTIGFGACRAIIQSITEGAPPDWA